MASKALNKANLMTLDREVLAELLLETVKGDATRQRRVRMALAADQGPQAVTADVRKRFATIRRARSYISRKSQKKLGQELEDLVRLVERQVAPEVPDLAFDLLWAQLHLAEGIYERTDDSWGTIGDAMRAAMKAIRTLSERMTANPEALGESVFDALVADGYGAFDNAVEALAPALGDTGLALLKAKAETAREAPLALGDMAFYDYISDPAEQKARAIAARNRSLDIILQDVADQQGDVDSWLAQYTPEQLTYHTIAPAAAARLLEAGRAEEALALIEKAVEGHDTDWRDPGEMDNVHFDCLQALGRTNDLRAALWARFEKRLCPDALHHHLKLLPDFEDIDAEDAARQVVLSYPSVDAALAYCLKARDLTLACQVIDTRNSEVDGKTYEVLTPLAEALLPEHPLRAVLIWRVMIDFALNRNRKGRYSHAARHLASCAAADAAITDYGAFQSHSAYFNALSDRHARKASFWASYGSCV